MPEYEGTYFFLSDELTGTGSAQEILHNLGWAPAHVIPMLTGGPASYTQPSITLGPHTTTAIVATVTTGWKYRVLAYA